MDAVAQNEASPVERDVGEAQTEGYRWVGVGEVGGINREVSL